MFDVVNFALHKLMKIACWWSRISAENRTDKKGRSGSEDQLEEFTRAARCTNLLVVGGAQRRKDANAS